MSLASLVWALAMTHLALLFSVAGATKIAKIKSFQAQLTAHRILGPSKVRAAAWLVPPFEIVLGIWMVSSQQARAAAIAASVVLGGFFVYRIALLRGRQSAGGCGCFGPQVVGKASQPRAEAVGVLVNLIIAVAVAISAGSGRSYSTPISIAAASAMAVLAALIVARLVYRARRRRVEVRGPAAELSLGPVHL